MLPKKVDIVVFWAFTIRGDLGCGVVPMGFGLEWPNAPGNAKSDCPVAGFPLSVGHPLQVPVRCQEDLCLQFIDFGPHDRMLCQKLIDRVKYSKFCTLMRNIFA